MLQSSLESFSKCLPVFVVLRVSCHYIFGMLGGFRNSYGKVIGVEGDSNLDAGVIKDGETSSFKDHEDGENCGFRRVVRF